jgi:death on curing protein
MKIKHVYIPEVEYAAHRLAKGLMSGDEPIPEFGTRFPEKLESCLEVPFQTFDGKALYRSIVGKAAVLFYLLIKNHPFKNGNKRIAVMTLLYFLHKNGKWIHVTPETLYRFARGIASSERRDMDFELAKIREFLRVNLIHHTS